METELILLLLLFTTFQLAKSQETDIWVNPTLVQSDPGAVCLTGKPASCYYVPGFGNGAHSWLVYLCGGAWCDNPSYCIQYAHDRNITKDPLPYQFTSILSINKEKNPDFFDWNKVVITYCDGGSFTGDSENVYNATKLYFKGVKIFNATMQELLHKGMAKAHNALLVGSSAGGVAATLHCDRFRNLLPFSARVKCLSDAGYFFSSEKFKDQESLFVPIFQRLITLHGSTNSLPKSCTTRMEPYLCYFPQNVQHDIKTPIFFLMSAFDYVQITWTFPKNKNTISTCFSYNNCSSELNKSMQDLRSELLNALPEKNDTSIDRDINYLSRDP